MKPDSRVKNKAFLACIQKLCPNFPGTFFVSSSTFSVRFFACFFMRESTATPPPPGSLYYKCIKTHLETPHKIIMLHAAYTWHINYIYEVNWYNYNLVLYCTTHTVRHGNIFLLNEIDSGGTPPYIKPKKNSQWFSRMP